VDYLDLEMTGGADALWEQLRRLARASVWTGRDQTEADGDPYGERRVAEGIGPTPDAGGSSGGPEGLRMEQRADRGRRDDGGEPDGADRAGPGQEEGWPLADQLRQLDRRAAAGVQAAVGTGRDTGDAERAERRSAWPAQRGGAVGTDRAALWEERRRTSARAQDARPLGGGDWVEQADRIFRRDSRRYDSGFYLY